MITGNVEVRGESRVDLTTTCSLVGRVTRLTSKQADGSSDGSGDEKFDVRDVHTFLGVPYAKPPVGDLMFKDPEPVELWQGEKQAAEFGPACYQDLQLMEMTPFKAEIATSMSLDCLHLNIWTPNKSRDAGLPVMVWFYGGAFMLGFTEPYRGDVLANFHDVVIVTVTYRIGVWGFLCTPDGAATGNYGLLDQIESLRWVQKYIRNFGGDPNNVTIFGESAGAMSAAFLMVSPLAKDLFKNAISQSGTVLTMGQTRTPAEAYEAAKSFLKHVGCEATVGEDIVSFMRSQPPEKLVVPPEFLKHLSFAPVVDGKVIPARGLQLLSSKYLPKKNYMIGKNSDEGAFGVLAMTLMMGIDAQKVDNSLARMIFLDSVKIQFLNKDVEKEFEPVFQEYCASKSGADLVKALIDFSGDLSFVSSTIKTADAQSDVSTVYVYSFDKRNAFVKYPDYVRADHGCEVPSVFGLPYLFSYLDFSAEDRALCRTMMTYWTNFAKTGNPNGQGLEEWPEYTKQERKYIVLDTPVKQATNLGSHRIDVLNEAVAKCDG